MRLNTQNFTDYLLFPIKALFSKQFYFKVLFELRGTGFLYLFILSAVFAIPATYKSMEVVDYFKSLELSKLVAQLPPSYLDQNGTLSPNNEQDAYKVITSSSGRPAIVFNTNNEVLSGDALSAPVEFKSSAITVHTEKGDAEITYNSVFETGTNFNPMQMAQVIDEVLNASTRLIWSAMVLWSLVLLLINTLLTACISRFMMLFIFRIRVAFLSALRLCAFANTIVAVLILAQFFIYLPISYTLMLVFPLLYVGAFSHAFRKELAVIGLEGFKAKYAKHKNNAQNGAQENSAHPFEMEKHDHECNHEGNCNVAMDKNMQNVQDMQGDSVGKDLESSSNESQAKDNNKRDHHDDKPQGPGCFEA